jgi:creatinine amidohydrolase
MSTPRRHLGDMTTDETRMLLASGRVAVLVPVGSVEPHGPHLPLFTDTLISEQASTRAIELLRLRNIQAVVGPSVPYGVTQYAAGFAGAIGVSADALVAFLRAVCEQFLATGFAHVCLVNNHLEPAHDEAVRASVAGFAKGTTSVACPLTRRWGRTLTDEYKRGNCHAGRYETSLVLAGGAEVRAGYEKLPSIDTSLADGIRSGKKTFAEMGLDRAYTGSPAEASREEGEATYEKLAEMIATEVAEALDRAGG